MEMNIYFWKTKLAIALVAIIAASVYIIGADNDEAMAKCQLTYSYDTCFHSLNR